MSNSCRFVYRRRSALQSRRHGGI